MMTTEGLLALDEKVVQQGKGVWLCGIGGELSANPHLPGLCVPVARIFE